MLVQNVIHYQTLIKLHFQRGSSNFTDYRFCHLRHISNCSLSSIRETCNGNLGRKIFLYRNYLTSRWTITASFQAHTPHIFTLEKKHIQLDVQENLCGCEGSHGIAELYFPSPAEVRCFLICIEKYQFLILSSYLTFFSFYIAKRRVCSLKCFSVTIR